MGLIKTTSTNNYLKKSLTDAESNANAEIQAIDLTINPNPGNLQASGLKTLLNVGQNTIGIGASLAIDPNPGLSNLVEAVAASAGTVMPCRFLALEVGTGYKMVLIQGFIRNDSWTFTPGDVLYTSTSSGGITNVEPSVSGEYVQFLGYAVTASTIYFDPDKTYITLS